jgi:hypothetical protein
MAASSNIEAMLNGIADPAIHLTLKSVFRYLLSTLAFGRATAGGGVSAASTAVPSVNFLGGFTMPVTTPATANREFTIPHSFGRAPYLLIPVMPLDQVGASTVRLTVSRPADAANVYLKSPEVNQSIFVYLEG